MVNYDTLAEVVFREWTLREAEYRNSSGDPARPVATTTPRQRAAGLLMALATWLAPVAPPIPTATKQPAS